MKDMNPIPVVLAGATGRTGQVVGRGIHQALDMELVGAIGHRSVGQSLGALWGEPDLSIVLQRSISDIRVETAVLVDFTEPDSAEVRVADAIERGWDVVMGTTGFDDGQQHRLQQLVLEAGVGAAFIPNFSLGSWVAEQMARAAAQYLSSVEIVEAHSAAKKDRPSGTARRMNHLLADWMDKPPDSIPVHSIRLPGLVAHQAVMFGSVGQVVTIRHDVHDRSAYVEGVLMAIRAVRGIRGRLLNHLSEVWDLTQ